MCMQKLYENKTHTTKLVKIENKKWFSLKKKIKKEQDLKKHWVLKNRTKIENIRA